MDLMVLADNVPALALYRAAGFVQTGRTQDHFIVDGRHLDSVAMTLAL